MPKLKVVDIHTSPCSRWFVSWSLPPLKMNRRGTIRALRQMGCKDDILFFNCGTLFFPHGVPCALYEGEVNKVMYLLQSRRLRSQLLKMYSLRYGFPMPCNV